MQTINIKNKQEATRIISKFKEKRYKNIDVRFKNTRLKRINILIGTNIFYKNDLFVNSDTLWEIMQPFGEKGSHNYHNLTAKEIVEVVSDLTNPQCVFKTKDNSRYGIVSLIISENGKPLIVIIEIGAGLIGDTNANVNKFVTMYPKGNLKDILKRLNEKEILFIK